MLRRQASWLIRLTVLVFIIVIATACSRKKIKLKIVLDCTPAIYFDTLTHVLLSNDYSDLGGRGERSGVNNVFYPGRVYLTDVVRNAAGYFVIDNIAKGQYEYLFVEGYTAGAAFSGFQRKLDFRNSSDTAVVTICMKANISTIPND